MLLANDIVLVYETRSGVNATLEVWRQTLKPKGFRLSRTKTEYLECKFSDVAPENGVEVRRSVSSHPQEKMFQVPRPLIQGNGEIDACHTPYWCWMGEMEASFWSLYHIS